jgi:hypothetical protein
MRDNSAAYLDMVKWVIAMLNKNTLLRETGADAVLARINAVLRRAGITACVVGAE